MCARTGVAGTALRGAGKTDVASNVTTAWSQNWVCDQSADVDDGVGGSQQRERRPSGAVVAQSEPLQPQQPRDRALDDPPRWAGARYCAAALADCRAGRAALRRFRARRRAAVVPIDHRTWRADASSALRRDRAEPGHSDSGEQPAQPSATVPPGATARRAATPRPAGDSTNSRPGTPTARARSGPPTRPARRLTTRVSAATRRTIAGRSSWSSPPGHPRWRPCLSRPGQDLVKEWADGLRITERDRALSVSTRCPGWTAGIAP
jgi:hypothetical protein